VDMMGLVKRAAGAFCLFKKFYGFSAQQQDGTPGMPRQALLMDLREPVVTTFCVLQSIIASRHVWRRGAEA